MSIKCNHCGKNVEIDVTNMTQDEFIRRKLDLGYIDFRVFGCTIDELKKIIDFAKSRNYFPNQRR